MQKVNKVGFKGVSANELKDIVKTARMLIECGIMIIEPIVYKDAFTELARNLENIEEWEHGLHRDCEEWHTKYTVIKTQEEFDTHVKNCGGKTVYMEANGLPFKAEYVDGKLGKCYIGRWECTDLGIELPNEISGLENNGLTSIRGKLTIRKTNKFTGNTLVDIVKKVKSRDVNDLVFIADGMDNYKMDNELDFIESLGFNTPTYLDIDSDKVYYMLDKLEDLDSRVDYATVGIRVNNYLLSYGKWLSGKLVAEIVGKKVVRNLDEVGIQLELKVDTLGKNRNIIIDITHLSLMDGLDIDTGMNININLYEQYILLK